MFLVNLLLILLNHYVWNDLSLKTIFKCVYIGCVYAFVISLKRKYPLTRKAFTTALRLKHSMFQAAHKEDFSDAVTVHTFKEYSVSGSINVSDTTKYRYWRYICPKPYRFCI